MSQIDLIKCNGYVAQEEFVGQVRLAKTNAYGTTLGVPGHTLLTKTNAYGVTLSTDGHTLLAKINAYGVLDSAEIDAQVIHPDFLNGDVSEVFAPILEQDETPKFQLREMERNPYRPHISDDPSTIWKDYREQQRIIREQHNITQGGDTTFDYGLLLRTYPNEEFTPGSLGRFFHDDYGLAMARFVKCHGFVAHPFQGQPVGRLKFNNDEGVNWTVTNDLSQSGKDLAEGFTFFVETPADGIYGWMVVSGANPAQIKNATGETPTQNAPYTWNATGEITLGGSGRILARAWGLKKRPGLSPGTLFINPEGMSIQDMIDVVKAGIEELTSLEDILDRLDEVERINGIQTTDIRDMSGDLINLANRLEGGLTMLGTQIEGIRNQTNTAWGPIIEQGDNAVRNELTQVANVLQAGLTALTVRVANIEALLAAFNIAEMYESIQNITAQLVNLLNTASQVWMPLIDGSIPPTFIQNPDGNLVYVGII